VRCHQREINTTEDDWYMCRGFWKGDTLCPFEEHWPEPLRNPVAHDRAVPIPSDVCVQALRPRQSDNTDLRRRERPILESREGKRETLHLFCGNKIDKRIPHAHSGLEIDGHVDEIIQPRKTFRVHRFDQIFAEEGAWQVAQHDRRALVLRASHQLRCDLRELTVLAQSARVHLVRCDLREVIVLGQVAGVHLLRGDVREQIVLAHRVRVHLLRCDLRELTVLAGRVEVLPAPRRRVKQHPQRILKRPRNERRRLSAQRRALGGRWYFFRPPICGRLLRVAGRVALEFR